MLATDWHCVSFLGWTTWIDNFSILGAMVTGCLSNFPQTYLPAIGAIHSVINALLFIPTLQSFILTIGQCEMVA